MPWRRRGPDDSSSPLPPEVLADITDLLAACPAFLGVPGEQLAALARTGEIDYLAAERAPHRPAFVVMRGAVYLKDVHGHTVDVDAEGEFAAPAPGEHLAPVDSSLVVWLAEPALDRAWSLPADQLPRRVVRPDRPVVDLQLAPVRTVMRSPVHIARPEETCREVAQRMSETGVSSVIMEIGGEVAIATDRDLRTRLVAQGRSADTPIGDIATSPATTVDAQSSVFEVLVEMLARGIHHLPVVESGRVVGMVSSGDLNQLGARSPLHVRVAVDRAPDVAGVAEARAGLPDMVGSLLQAGMSAAASGTSSPGSPTGCRSGSSRCCTTSSGPPPRRMAGSPSAARPPRADPAERPGPRSPVLPTTPDGRPADLVGGVRRTCRRRARTVRLPALQGRGDGGQPAVATHRVGMASRVRVADQPPHRAARDGVVHRLRPAHRGRGAAGPRADGTGAGDRAELTGVPGTPRAQCRQPPAPAGGSSAASRSSARASTRAPST
ncbi:MAG: CBS domain-containing protein [Nocardioides sp.]